MIVDLKDCKKAVYINSEETVLEALNKEGILVYAPCGGKGDCGKCKIKIKGQISPITKEERKILTKEEIYKGIRLACKTYLYGQAEAEILEEQFTNESKGKLGAKRIYAIDNHIVKKVVQLDSPTFENGYTMADAIKKKLGNVHIGLKIMRYLSHHIDYTKDTTFTLYKDELIDIEYEDTRDQIYGIAIDIGTTTVVCYLIDLVKGVSIEVSSMQNPQVGYGADVISRINYTLENKDGLEILNKRIIHGIDELIHKVMEKTKIEKRHIYECVLVANTTMTHLFLGLDASSLSRVPFNAVTKEIIIEDAEQIGIKNINTKGKVVFLPGIAGFVGADTVGAMIAANLINNKDIKLLIDLGTNGEIVLSTPKGNYACSTAAGPAFEGAKIKYGMQAFSGAINQVEITDDLYYTTIDQKPAKGICGSGLIDIVSELLRVGIIREDGKIVDTEDLENEKLARRIIKNGSQKEVIIAYENETQKDGYIAITQKDIREIQLAKGAIRGGINILLKVAKVKINDIDKILLAGTFGNFINKESARRIGVFPNVSMDKIISIGNAAGEGAITALCNQTVIQEQAEVYSSTTKHIEISNHPDFQDEFLEGMYLK
ncbi:ASKHA domain-containing protein [Crassaminicella profunda]|uniref:ASKHA domain-containing protein n=1 Tax=Crassaminicella profunda TaxID=1286698 RepID=UPI001FE79883|nr:ASKHA domain-containing protein [Crassaminicella profunda]